MTALLERLNASRRFARSVYAPHKLALRQGVPSALRAVGVTAPVPQVMNASRSVAPRVIAAAAPIVARADAVPTSAVGQPNRLPVANPVALEGQTVPSVEPHASVNLEPQGLTNLEPQGLTNLEPQGLTTLEPQGAADFESPATQQLEPEYSSNFELPLGEAAFSAAPPEVASASSLESAPPAKLTLSESMLGSNDGVIAQALLIEAAPAPASLEQPIADTEPIGVQPSALANAPALPVTQMQGTAERSVSPPVPRAIAAPQGAVQERAQASALGAEISPEPERVEVASAMLETTVAAPDQPLEPPLAISESVRPEPQLTAPDLELSRDVPTVSEPMTDALVANDPAPLEVLPAPLIPEGTAPSVAAPVSLEVAAPIVTVPPAADRSAPSPAPIQPTVKGRVIEEFQARPPRNMPPRNMPQRNLKPVTPEAAPEAPIDATPIDATPRRSPEEWARLLRQRFAQPGDEAFDDAPIPEAPATPKAAPLEPITSHSSTPAPTTPEPSAVIAAAPLEAVAAPSSTSVAVTIDESEPLSAAVIRERSQAALQAIPEDMSQRTPRDWGMALIRRYASPDEAAAIGIDAYRDPNDPTPIPAPVPATLTQPVRTVAPQGTPPSTISNATVSSSTALSRLIAPAPLESAPSPARRFVAPRMAVSVSSTAPSLSAIAPVQAESFRAQLAPQHRSPAPLEQPSSELAAAARIPASLEPNRSRLAPFESAQVGQQPPIAADAAPDAPLALPTLETEGFAAPHTESGQEPAIFEPPQTPRAAPSERRASDASSEADLSAATLLQDTAQLDAPIATPTLEPVTLSGATRRFLEPLVGFDPNEVSVYTGETASRVTRDLRADAAAQAGAVLLPDASNLETPVQLGLLAHELIHAAQQQQSAGAPQPDAPLEPVLDSTAEDAAAELPSAAQPLLETPRLFESVSRRFVPAVSSSDTRSTVPASSAVQPSNTAQSSHAVQSRHAVQPSNAVRQSRAPLLEGMSGFASEEDRALAAEARVVQIARTESLSADPTLPAAASWNGLPAPWELLPSFDAPSSDDFSSDSGVVSLVGAGLSPQGWGASATTSNLSGYGGSVSSSNAGFSSSAGSSSSAPSAAQAAEIGRELPEASAAAGGGQDLEQLAKQVYDVLKRRLQSDRRRGGL